MTIEVSDDVGQFIIEVLGERVLQDNQWGGTAHDDLHNHKDWRSYIRYQLRADGPFEKRLIKVAALAMAAFESNRRKHGTDSRQR